jgi:hypothetical protein
MLIRKKRKIKGSEESEEVEGKERKGKQKNSHHPSQRIESPVLVLMLFGFLTLFQGN